MHLLDKLKQSENRKLEFKRQLPVKSDWLKTIISFANGAGGELMIGISDAARDVVGVEDSLALEEKIANMIADNVRPFISPYISVLNRNGKEILIVKILPGNDKPYFRKNEGDEKGVYIRIGSTNRRASSAQIRDLRRQNRGLSFESEIHMSVSVDDLEKDSVSRFLESIEQGGFLKKKLAKWKILQQNNGDYFPTTAGLVLFGKDKLLDFDYASVRVTKYTGITLSNIAETAEFSIPIIDRIDDICRKVEDFLQKESVLKGARRLERTIIPNFAIREVVVNAIVHRDYGITGSSIKINIFDDRLEVISPGILFGNLDISDIGTGLSECRNRSMVRIFRRLNLMEELGTGIARILELFEGRNLKRPVFAEQGQFFKAILPQERDISDNSDRLLELLTRLKEASAAVLAQRTGLHHNTILKYLKPLLVEGKVIKSGSAKNTVYKIK